MMRKAKTVEQTSVLLQSNDTGRTREECLSTLFTEIQLAFTWNRSVLLFALSNSKNVLEKAMGVLEGQLIKTQQKVIDIHPPFERNNILEIIVNFPNTSQYVFFVHGLGKQKEVYAGLNFYREHVVERGLKIVLWLLDDEIFKLARQAPDFWAFRHRVVEFSNKGSRGIKLPSGVLLWNSKEQSIENDTINSQITMKKDFLSRFPKTTEGLKIHAEIVYDLAHLYWLKGENQASLDLLHQELTSLDAFQLLDVKSMLLNGLAINYYDQDNFKESFHLTKTALDASPNNVIIQANHAVICRAARKSKQAIPWVKKALRINSEAPHLWGVSGFLFIEMGKYKSALESFENAFTLASQNFRYCLAIAICHSKVGNSDLFDKTMRLIPNHINDNNFYYEICTDGLSGNSVSGLNHLKSTIHDKKILPSFVRRDPILNLIFSPEQLETALQS